MIYLDYAAATPVDDRVVAAMEPYWQERFHNPSALYTAARAVRDDLEEARARCARMLGARSAELLFTAGATEANNVAIAGIMKRYPGAAMVTTNIEHDSVRFPAHSYANAAEVAVGPDGRVGVDAVGACIQENTVLISVEYVNSEIGTVQPLRDIARVVAGVRRQRKEAGNSLPLYLHTDASQAVGRLSADVSSLGVDMATVNGAKIYGPKQSGVLYVKYGTELEPLLHGGGQERGLRTGTENVAFAAGIAAALELAEELRSAEYKRLRPLQKQLLERATGTGGRVNGSMKHRVPDNLNISFPGVDGETLVHHLDARGIQTATGSACSANNDTPSNVLVALGCDEAAVNSSLRISLGRHTSENDIIYTADTLEERVPRLREK